MEHIWVVNHMNIKEFTAFHAYTREGALLVCYFAIYEIVYTSGTIIIHRTIYVKKKLNK